jgi:HEPN domain-containing protein
MQDAEIAELVRKKRFLINAFLFSGSLSPGAGPDSALKHAITGHFLQAVVLELLVKILFELDTKKQAPFTHNLPKVYKELDSTTRKKIEDSYGLARERKRQLFANIPDVTFGPLSDVLRNNETIVKNFKYDAMGVESNSAFDAEFYNEISSYIDQRVSELRV